MIPFLVTVVGSSDGIQRRTKTKGEEESSVDVPDRRRLFFYTAFLVPPTARIAKALFLERGRRIFSLTGGKEEEVTAWEKRKKVA